MFRPISCINHFIPKPYPNRNVHETDFSWVYVKMLESITDKL